MLSHSTRSPVANRRGEFDRRLHAHSTIENIAQDLDLTERLKMAAGNAERHYGFAVSGEHRRNDRVQRPFTTGDCVGMAAFQHKT